VCKSLVIKTFLPRLYQFVAVEKSSQKTNQSVRLYDHKKLHLPTLKKQLNQALNDKRIALQSRIVRDSIGAKKLVSKNKNTAID
jgi:hypothetical protein